MRDFTLIEMSIVLVIIGLLAAGITGDGDENGTIERGKPRQWLYSWQILY